MLREMEKVFENLKEEFNRKISTDSFISYFVKHNDVDGGASSSDSFEDISVDNIQVQNLESVRHSLDTESLLIGSVDDPKMNIIDPVKRDYTKQLAICHGTKVLSDTDGEIVGQVQKDTRKQVADSVGYDQKPDQIIRNDIASYKLLRVINEEDGIDQSRIKYEYRNASRQLEIGILPPVSTYEKSVIVQNDRNQGELEQNESELPNQSKTSSEIIKSKNHDKNDECEENVILRDDRDRKSMLNNFKKQSLHRMMWSELPEVIESGILSELTKKEIQLQEAMFEIIASEASYYQSLMILTTHFFDSDLFKLCDTKDFLVSSIDKHHIFSNVILIMFTSQNFMNDLDRRWREQKPVLTQICDIILKHASSDDFQNYVTYLRNQEYQRKALKRLEENELFRQQLHKLETSSVCGKLSIDSYLMLPMQRLTRLKLLLDALLKLMNCKELASKVTEDHIGIAEATLDKLKQLLDDSDFEKGFMDQKSSLMLLMNRMDFPANFKRIAISDKMFLKEDDVRVHQQNPLKHIRKFSKKRQPAISLILFHDLLIVAKKKGSRLLVIDYCDRSNIEVTETLYKSFVSSADIPNNLSSVDLDERPEDLRKMSLTSLARSRTSMSAEDWKRFNASLTNSFRSMSLTSRNDEQEIINNSFSLKFLKSQTDIFSVFIVLLAKNKIERDEWMDLLNNNNSNDGKLHKTTSLRNNGNRKEDFRLSKNLSLYGRRSEKPIQLLSQSPTKDG